MLNSFQEFKTYLKIAALILNKSLLCSAKPVGNYMFKANNRNIRKKCEVCSKVTIKTPLNGDSGVVLVSLLLTLKKFHTLFYNPGHNILDLYNILEQI